MKQILKILNVSIKPGGIYFILERILFRKVQSGIVFLLKLHHGDKKTFRT